MDRENLEESLTNLYDDLYSSLETEPVLQVEQEQEPEGNCEGDYL